MKSKKGAMELSVGTIVILVLAMSMLILGLVLVRTIFSSATGAITEVDKGVKDAISKAFADSDKKLVMYPTARKIEIKQRTQGEGFAFSVRNLDNEDRDFKYSVYVDKEFNIITKCKIKASDADSWTDVNSGTITLGRGAAMDSARLVTLTIPEGAPLCTIPFVVDIKYNDGSYYSSDQMLLTIKPK
ncbi:hypothetical protein J4429_05550 [Candidatus Pacearchaeota archaeon]|nr:hypothetical protein [Candidatus Pacearchaeota archaeon]